MKIKLKLPGQTQDVKSDYFFLSENDIRLQEFISNNRLIDLNKAIDFLGQAELLTEGKPEAIKILKATKTLSRRR
jgi:hypothetical protein